MLNRVQSFAGVLCAVLVSVAAVAEPGHWRLDAGGPQQGEYIASEADPAANTAAIVAAVDALAGASALLELRGGVVTIEELELPPTVSLRFGPGGAFNIREGAALLINGFIDAGAVPIFTGPGVVGGAVQNQTILPQWFGAKGDGEHDNGPAIQRAADLAASSLGRTLFIPRGDYAFAADITFRCNIESQGRFIKRMEVDEARTQFSNDLFLPTHYLTSDPELRFGADHPEVELDAAAFFGIQEGQMSLPRFRAVPLADGSGEIDLEEGATLRFYSSDFFSSRNVRKGAHYYDKNDIVQIVSGRGDVFPEFAFDYPAPPDAPAWDESTRYKKGDYCTWEGEVFKATWASGPESGFEHRHFGKIDIGPVPPEAGSSTTNHAFAYEDGTKDSIALWRKVDTRVYYRKPDAPLTVSGLRMELQLLNHEGEVKRINGGAMTVNRSNMTFSKLAITVRDPEATMNRLLQSTGCVNNTFNEGYFSGATSAHLGYNILNSNVANFRYNHCISTNSRKGMDGRHGKNIVVQGGSYNVINDHYGRNYTIRDITLTGLSVFVPGDSTPKADLQNWRFGQRSVLGFNGANLHLENITVNDGGGGILAARSDIGDLYGDIVLRDISVRQNPRSLDVFRHTISGSFDYAHEVRTPNRLTIENIRVERPARLEFNFGGGFGDQPYGPVHIRQVEGIHSVYSGSPRTRFVECRFENARFQQSAAGAFSFHECTIEGETKGLEDTSNQ